MIDYEQYKIERIQNGRIPNMNKNQQMYPALSVYLTMGIVIIFIIFTAYDIGRLPIDLHQFRQTQTLSTIENFYTNGIDLFGPELDTNGSHSKIILEFPIYQGISAFLMHVFGDHYAVPRLVSIFSILIASFSISFVFNQYLVRGSFLFVMAFILINPSTIFWSTAILPDATGLSFSVTGLSLFWYSIKQKHICHTLFITSILITAVGVCVKPTFLFVFAIFFTFIVLRRFVQFRELKIVFSFLIYFLCVGIFYLLWSFYASSINSENPHIYTDYAGEWYFGTNEQRFNLEIWTEFFKRWFYNGLGLIYIPVIALSLLNAKYLKESLFFVLYVSVGFLLYLIIFVNLNFVHTYYQLPIFFLVSSVSGLLAFELVKFLTKRAAAGICLVATLLILTASSNFVLRGSWVDLGLYSTPYKESSCEYNIGTQIHDILDYHGVDPLLVGIDHGGGPDCWNGPHAIMYYLGERGFVFRNNLIQYPSDQDLDFFISFNHNSRPPVIDGWENVLSQRLNGTVSDFFVHFYVPDVGVPLSGTIKIDVPETTLATEELGFVHLFTEYDLNIPLYSEVEIVFDVNLSDKTDKAYLLIRYYDVGYDADIFRNISDGHNVIEARFVDGSDYNLHLGVYDSGMLYNLSSIVINYKSIFERNN